MSRLNGGNVIALDDKPNPDGWYTLIDDTGRPFLKVDNLAWAFFLAEIINNRGSEPDEPPPRPGETVSVNARKR